MVFFWINLLILKLQRGNAVISERSNDMGRVKEAYDHLLKVIEEETGMIPTIEIILDRPNEGGIGPDK